MTNPRRSGDVLPFESSHLDSAREAVKRPGRAGQTIRPHRSLELGLSPKPKTKSTTISVAQIVIDSYRQLG